MRFLLNRTDNIGDLVLTLPAAGLIKAYYPGAQVYLLGRNYIQDMIAYATDVDGFLNWNALQEKPLEEAIKEVQSYHFDAFLNIFAYKPTALFAKQAGIPTRVGTSHNLYHWFLCNKLIHFSRNRSGLHEIQLNTQLLQPFSIPTKLTSTQLLHYLHLRIPPLKPEFAEKLASKQFKLIVHPGSNHHGREWPSEYFRDLIDECVKENIQVF